MRCICCRSCTGTRPSCTSSELKRAFPPSQDKRDEVPLGEEKKSILTTSDFVRTIEAIVFAVAFPGARDAPLVAASAPDLSACAVGDARLVVLLHKELVGAGTGEILRAGRDQAQVRTAAILLTARVRVCNRITVSLMGNHENCRSMAQKC